MPTTTPARTAWPCAKDPDRCARPVGPERAGPPPARSDTPAPAGTGLLPTGPATSFADPRLADRRSEAQRARIVRQLQRTCGNAQVARIVAALQQTGPRPAVQRQVACPAPPVAPTSAPPEENPAFAAVTGKLAKQGRDLKRHPPPKAKAAEAGKAAEPPAGDVDAQAKAAHTDSMHQAKPAAFDKAAFIAAVHKAIADASPKNLDEADKFASSGKAEGVKNQVMDKVAKGKDESAKDVKDKASQPPDPSAAKPKPVVPLQDEKPGPKPAEPGAAKAMPPPAPKEQTDVRAGKCETDSQMAEAGITEEQLAKSNEPEFQEAVAAKREGEAHSQSAPAQVKAQEQATLIQAKQGASAEANAALGAMHGSKASAAGKVDAGKTDAKSKDEQKRAQVTAEIQKVYDKTKADTTAILAGIDEQVTTRFNAGEQQARTAFETYHKTEMQKYKDRRYAGASGAVRWTADLFTGLPEEANRIFVRARTLYLEKMNLVISDVADLVSRELTRAKDRINQGRQQIKDYVAKLPADLKKVGAEAEKDFADKFDELDRSVDEKQEALVSDLAMKYCEARDKVDEDIKKLQEDNKGLWDRAKDAVGGAIETIKKLKDLLMGALSRAAGAIEKIIKDPIGFLGRLVSAVKSGVQAFAANIATHLKSGLMGWLFGELGKSGLELPKSFDFKGILGMILSMLGLTWAAIRARIVKVLGRAGERIMGTLEKVFQPFVILVTQGPAGLWKFLKDKLADLKEQVLGPIKDFVITKVIVAGVTWLVSMLNPASAFIKACKAIYDIVMFLVNQAMQLAEFVNSIVDSFAAIAGGAMGAVSSLIEKTLARILPLAISFLASLLGLGGIGEKIKSIFQAIRGPVMKAVDAVIKPAITLGKKLLKKLAGKFKRKGKTDERSPAEKERDLKTAVGRASAVAKDTKKSKRVVARELKAIKKQYRMQSLDLVVDSHGKAEDKVHIHGAINPTYDGDGFITSPFPPDKVVIDAQIGPSQPRANYERKVLESPGRAGLPGYERAHLLGAGFGVESPLGLYYAPRFVNQILQNQGIEDAIRESYKNRYPGAQLFIRAEATPRPGTDILARVVYTLSGSLPGEPRTDICQFRIIVGGTTAAPTWKVQAGDVDPDAVPRYTSHLQSLMAALGPDV